MPTSQSTSNVTLKNLLRHLHRIEDSILAILLFAMILLASSQIFLRNLFDSGIVWADPLLRVMVLWLGLLGALAATRENKHISIDLLTRYLSDTMRDGVKSFTSLFSAIVCAIIAYHSLRHVMMEYESQSKLFLGLSAWTMEVIMPVAFTLITIRFLIHFVLNLRLLLMNRKTQA